MKFELMNLRKHSKIEKKIVVVNAFFSDSFITNFGD